MINDRVEIIYHKFCPYAHRALIAAIEKEVPAKFVSTGLGEDTKTKYFRECYAQALGRDLQSQGKVPILIHNEKYLTESELVCWYLAETFPGGSQLIPADILTRTRMRVWIGQINVQMISIFDRAKLKQTGVLADFLQEVRGFLEKVESSIEGEYLVGDGISLADVLIYPWFERWVIIEHFFGYPIPEKFVKIRRWLGNMCGRKSVIETKKLTNDKFYIERTERMIKARL